MHPHTPDEAGLLFKHSVCNPMYGQPSLCSNKAAVNLTPAAFPRSWQPNCSFSEKNQIRLGQWENLIDNKAAEKWAAEPPKMYSSIFFKGEINYKRFSPSKHEFLSSPELSQPKEEGEARP